jgi:hypothetical protein
MSEVLEREISKLTSPSQLEQLYNFVLFLQNIPSSNNDTSHGGNVKKSEHVDFTSLPTVKPTYSLQEVFDDLRGER